MFVDGLKHHLAIEDFNADCEERRLVHRSFHKKFAQLATYGYSTLMGTRDFWVETHDSLIQIVKDETVYSALAA